ncbi:MAG: ATP-binding protein [Saprospiraceae bacterium]
MKFNNIIKFLVFVILSMLYNTSSFGQNATTKDSVYIINFKENQQRLLYFNSVKVPWLFHNGNNNDWAKPTLDVEEWTILNPKDLDENYADKNGNIEGWFRIKIKLDNSWKNKPLRLTYNGMAAAEVYIDGKLFDTYGNLGSDGQEFRFFSENNPSPRIELSLNETHTIAVHIKDKLIYPTQISGAMIGFQTGGSKALFLFLMTDEEHYRMTLQISASIIYNTILPVVNFIIGFLFFFLYLLNKKEKNLLLYTGVSVSLGINIIAITFFNFAGYIDLQPVTLLYLNFTFGFTFSLILLLLLFSIIKIFNITLSGLNRWLYIIFLSFILINGISVIISFYTNNYNTILGKVNLISYILFTLILIYWTIISFRHSSLPQKVIAYGVILFFLIIIIFIIATNIFEFNLGATLTYNIITAIYSCFPISLLAYVVLRFQEINKNIVSNAQQILKLSEEKRAMAEGQQKLLEVQVTQRTEDLQKSLTDLKSTQAQLIQAEKMASLGELTAGIAHEIQNPLNFVNNFSEVSKELLEEMMEAIEMGDTEEVKDIMNDVIQNLDKINHHGKRADAIVKGMLQHSRSSIGVKEPTDINALADEYLRLAYHGLRAKDKSFNAELVTNFDTNIPKINVIPQDIGRVILNLITNAFYAVNEKKKSGIEGYEPTVTVMTTRAGSLGVGGEQGKIESVQILVADNGNGIPLKVLDKIFQPFFTTKPTGQGTGLGLSLAYDIVKAHGGEIKVNTKENDGIEFIIQLPAV